MEIKLMDINNSNTELLMQVRTGHRLLVAFYQRLYSNLDKLASELGLSFYVWRPANFDRPATLSINPFQKWQWDLLPAMSSYFIFKTDFDNNKIVPGHCLVEIKVDLDTAVDGKSDLGGQPDALGIKTSIEESTSILSVRAYSPYQEIAGNWYYDLWSKCSNIPLSSEPSELDNFPVITSGFEIDIQDLLETEGLNNLIGRAKSIVESTCSASKNRL